MVVAVGVVIAVAATVMRAVPSGGASGGRDRNDSDKVVTVSAAVAVVTVVAVVTQ